jgi:hypothetical protein
LKIQNLNVLRGTEPKAASPAVKAAPAVSPASKPQGEPAKRNLADDERRRTQRVLLRVRASIHVALQGQAKTFDVATLSVNPHGAVVVMNQNLPAETRLVLEHAGTKERVTCKVARPPRPMAEGYHVPLEFDPPAPDFWKIDFPPSDWRPENL